MLCFFFNWDFFYQLGKNLNLAFGIGSTNSPVRPLEKVFVHIIYTNINMYT